MDPKLEKNRKRFKVLRISMWITLGVWVSMLLMSSSQIDNPILFLLIFLIGVVNGFVYLTYLGLLVSELNKSVFTWVGGTILFNVLGIGVMYSYFQMKTHAIKNGWD